MCSCSPLCFPQHGPTVSDLTGEATLVTRSPSWRLNNVSASIRFTSLPQHFKRHLISYLFTAHSRDLKFKIACIFNSKLSPGRRGRREEYSTFTSSPHFDKHDLPSLGWRDYVEQKLAHSPYQGLRLLGRQIRISFTLWGDKRDATIKKRCKT